MAMKRGYRNSHADLTAEYVRSILHYNRRTGVFKWRKMLSPNGLVGTVAGGVQLDGIRIGIKNKGYFAHRLAWLYVTGEWPKFEIDHKDTDQYNNCWNNLRDATSSQNQCNHKVHANNKCGVKGICFIQRTQKWMASIGKDKKVYDLGQFSTAEEARQAYQNAAKKLHGAFARFR